MKTLFSGKYQKPGKPIGEILKDNVVYDYNFCENELIIKIGEKLYKGMRVLMLKELKEKNKENS